MTEADLENALQAQIATAIAPAVVIWDRQRGPRPSPPYATLRFVGPGGYSGAAPEWQHAFDPDVAHGGTSPVEGGEVVETAIRHDDYDLRIQTYAVTPAAARALMLKARDRFLLRSTRDALRSSGGIVVAEVGALQDVGALLETDWEGRVALTLRIRITDTVTDRVGFVETVETVNGLE